MADCPICGRALRVVVSGRNNTVWSCPEHGTSASYNEREFEGAKGDYGEYLASRRGVFKNRARRALRKMEFTDPEINRIFSEWDESERRRARAEEEERRRAEEERIREIRERPGRALREFRPSGPPPEIRPGRYVPPEDKRRLRGEAEDLWRRGRIEDAESKLREAGYSDSEVNAIVRRFEEDIPIEVEAEPVEEERPAPRRRAPRREEPVFELGEPVIPGGGEIPEPERPGEGGGGPPEEGGPGGWREGPGTIFGYVYIEGTKPRKALEGASVFMDGKYKKTTNQDGFYEFARVTVGTHYIHVIMEGYETSEEKAATIPRGGGDINVGAIYLKRKAVSAAKRRLGHVDEEISELEEKGRRGRLDRKERARLRDLRKEKGRLGKRVVGEKKNWTEKVRKIRRTPEEVNRDLMRNAVGGLVMIVAGLIVSSIMNIPLFIYAFLCLGISLILPQPEGMRSVYRKQKEIMRKYEEEINKAETEEEKAKLLEELKSELEIQKMIGDIKWGVFWRDPNATNIIGRPNTPFHMMAFREFFRLLGIILFAWAFSTSAIPMARPIAIVIAFIGYFAVGGGRSLLEAGEK